MQSHPERESRKLLLEQFRLQSKFLNAGNHHLYSKLTGRLVRSSSCWFHNLGTVCFITATSICFINLYSKLTVSCTIPDTCHNYQQLSSDYCQLTLTNEWLPHLYYTLPRAHLCLQSQQLREKHKLLLELFRLRSRFINAGNHNRFEDLELRDFRFL